MFIGSWIINFTFSIIAFLFVFIGSITVNTAFTSFFRGSFAFVFFYAITFFFRWLWMLALKDVHVEEVDTQIDGVKEDQIENGKKDNNINKDNFTDEEIKNASEYVKELIND